MGGLALPPSAQSGPNDVLKDTVCPLRSAMVATPHGLAQADVPCRRSCMWFVPASEKLAGSPEGVCALKLIALR